MNLHDIIYKAKELVFLHKKISISAIIAFCILIIVFIYYFSFRESKINIANAPLSSYSSVKSEEGKTYFSINSESGYLYKSKRVGIEAVKDFLSQKPTYSTKRDLLPKNITENSTVTRTTKTSGINGTKEHYLLTQTLAGIPIYGTSLVVHIKNANEIYAISGNLSLNYKKTGQKITDEKAKLIALGSAQKEAPLIGFIIREPKKVLLNKKILDLSDDSTNHIALSMFVDSKERPLRYSTFYIVGLDNGEILFKENQFKDALNRTINNCNGLNCNTVRQEGGPVTGISDADSAYSIFSEVYNYYLQKFSRDSYDATGGPFIGYVNYDDPNDPYDCPNAGWTGQEMLFCPGLVAKDIAWHELTHAVTNYTANLNYEKQSGALNESISDIFGSASDNNWTMGEGSIVGVLRSMSDPPSVIRGNNPRQPDKLFSPYYYCRGLDGVCARRTNDYCGVHINSGIINKTFFLMTDGGSFNGCTISGVGREKSHAIIYDVLTNHLTQTSNFYDMYSSIQISCGDLYGSTSSTCAEVKKATQATELDQQPVGTQAGPFCPGSGITENTATCAGGSSAPTNTPTPTLAPGVPTNTPTPTSIPGCSNLGLACGVGCCQPNVCNLGICTAPATPTPTPPPTPSPTPGGPTNTPTPTPQQTYYCHACSQNGTPPSGTVKIGKLCCCNTNDPLCLP